MNETDEMISLKLFEKTQDEDIECSLIKNERIKRYISINNEATKLRIKMNEIEMKW